MIGIVPGFGPEIPRKAFSAVEDLEYDLNAAIPSEFSTSSKFGTIVINIIVINPKRGAIPNGVKLMRSSKELWTTWNIDFDKFENASSSEMRAQMRSGAIEALRMIDKKYIQPDVLSKIVELVEAVS
jgi:hypothetical protein